MTLTLPDVIQRVLANDPDLEISRILLEEADYNVTGAKGFYAAPCSGRLAQHSRAVTPIASIIGGSANGKLTNKEWDLNPSVSGSSPWLGGSYSMTFNNSQTITDSTFTTLNPQYPASVSLNLTQPLWRGLHFDTGRYQLQVALQKRRTQPRATAPAGNRRGHGGHSVLLGAGLRRAQSRSAGRGRTAGPEQ